MRIQRCPESLVSIVPSPENHSPESVQLVNAAEGWLDLGNYLEAVESVGVDVSMDGRGRWIDNRFIERLWRSVKQEDIYPHDYSDGLTVQRGLGRWFGDYNTRRPHQALGYATPGELYHSPESYGAKPAAWRWK